MTMPFNSDLLSAGLQYHQAGQFGRAQQIYRQILATDPRNADVWSLLGAACINLVEWDEALAHLREALRLDPNHPGALDNLGVLLANQNRFPEAITSFRKSLAIYPANPQTHLNLASALARHGQLPEAIPSYQEALRQAPDLRQAHLELAQILLQLRQPVDAAYHFRHAIRLNPQDPVANFNLAMALGDINQVDAAIAAYRETLRLKPDSAEAYVNISHLLMRQDKLDEAVVCLQHALRLRPEFAEAYINLGSALIRQKKYDEARVALEQALRLKPEIGQTYNNLGIVHTEQGRFFEAVATYRLALERQPDHPETLYNMGIALLKTGDLDMAIAYFKRALAIRPDYGEAHHNLAAALLLNGDFGAGLTEYEWRFKSRDYIQPQLRKPVWDGSSLAGRRIALVGEQGLGDTLQFVRYAQLVKQRAAKVYVECPGVLHPILARTPGVDAWTVSAASTDADCCVPLLSMPYRWQTTLSTVPADVPYVFADPALVASWRDRLSPIEGFRIGIVWQGNPQCPGDAFRSIPLAHYLALAKVPGVRLLSLQKGDGTEQLASVADKCSILNFDSIDTTAGAFMDTAAIMQNLDLVVTSDTATAHLAGALGVKAWIALSFVPDWRWLFKGETNPWYPTMRVFRQTRWNDWTPVFDRMASELRPLVP